MLGNITSEEFSPALNLGKKSAIDGGDPAFRFDRFGISVE